VLVLAYIGIDSINVNNVYRVGMATLELPTLVLATLAGTTSTSIATSTGSNGINSIGAVGFCKRYYLEHRPSNEVQTLIFI